MPPASKIRADMALRNILNPIEEDSHIQTSRATVSGHTDHDQDGLASNRHLPHEPVNVSMFNRVQAAKDDDDFKIRGHAEGHASERQSIFNNMCNVSSDFVARVRHDRRSGMPIPDVVAPGSTAEKLWSATRGPMGSNNSLQKTSSIASEPKIVSGDHSDEMDISSEESASEEPSQRSTWSSPKGQHASSQSTIYSNPYADVSKYRCSSAELGFQSCDSTNLKTQTLLPSNSQKTFNQSRQPAKRQRDSSSPDVETGASTNRHKIVKLSHSQPTVTNSCDTREVARKHHNAATLPMKNTYHSTTSPKPSNQPTQPPNTLLLSPSKSSIYLRRQSASPTRLPHLYPPDPRNQRLYHSPSPFPASPEPHLQPFNIFSTLLNHPDLTLEFSKHLDVDTLVSLYAISKAYHALVDTRFTALIMSQANANAPESAAIFSFRAYRNLCRRDPAGRLMLFSVTSSSSHVATSSAEAPGGQGREEIDRVATSRDKEVRFVPSFRWLKMLLHREATVARIIGLLAAEGHRLPKRATGVLKKLWFMLDIGDNGRRIGLFHDAKFWSNRDLFLVTMFFVKVDMRLTDPLTGTGEIGFRRLLLAQRGGLDMLARVLAREECRSQLEVLRLLVKFDYVPSRPLREGETVFGVPAAEVGRGCLEGWGKGERKFVPVDELVMREAVRRRLNLQVHYVDMMLHGYINKRTFQDIRTVPEGQTCEVVDGESEVDSLEDEGSESDEEQEVRRRERGLFEGETDTEEEGEQEEASLDEPGLGI